MNNEHSIIDYCAELSVEEISELKKNFKFSKYVKDKCGDNIGIYFLFNDQMQLLYIGHSEGGLTSRVGAHVKGSSNTADFHDEIAHVKLLGVEGIIEYRNTHNIDDEDDLEKHFVNLLRPAYNICLKSTEGRARNSNVLLTKRVEELEDDVEFLRDALYALAQATGSNILDFKMLNRCR